MFSEEYKNIFLWLPVYLGVGILIYFSLHNEPSVGVYITAGIIGLSALAILYKHSKHNNLALKLLLMGALFISAGFINAGFNTQQKYADRIYKEHKYVTVTATIDKIQYFPSRKRFVFKDVTTDKLNNIKLEKIRLTVNTDNNGATVDDKVTFLANLQPLPTAVIPNAYDFSRYAYFQQIGALGYAISDLKIIQDNSASSFMGFVNNLRNSITRRAIEVMGKDAGGVAAALLVGERSSIPTQHLDNIRKAGLAHLLAISGMHLVLVTSIFFIFTRYLLLLFKRIHLKYNIKKIAAVVALLGGGGYLLISGAPISAQRAFIMTSLFLFSIIIGRQVTPIRCIAIAATIILIATPSAILTPSFQMSFAAATALVTFCSVLAQIPKKYYNEHFPLPYKLTLYLAGIVSSSLIAGLATTPFAIYHFGNYSTYGMISNLIAIPLTTIIIMPLGVLSVLMSSLNLEYLPYVLMSYPIDIILNLSHYINSLPYSALNIGTIPNMAIAMIGAGGVWLCIWSNYRIKSIGILPIIIGIFITIYQHIPDIVIEDRDIFAVRGEDNLEIYNKKASKYSKKHWARLYNNLSNRHQKLNCDNDGCVYSKNNMLVAFSLHPNALIDDCKNADIVVNMTYQRIKNYKTCDQPQEIINMLDIKRYGTHTITLKTSGEIAIENVSHFIGNRPWNILKNFEGRI